MLNRPKLVIVINNEIPAGKVLNAVGHMTVGMAPRFPKDKFPGIQIYSASKDVVRNFRKEAASLNAKLTDVNSVFSDFAHTTTDGSARDHEKQTREIKEADINYYAACICADTNELTSLDELLNSKEYTLLKTSISNEDFSLEKPIVYPTNPTFTDEEKKFSIVLSPKLTGPAVIETMIKATIELGRSVNIDLMGLHTYFDASGQPHPGMSEFGLVALKGKNATKLQELEKNVPNTLNASTLKLDNNLIAVALFGKTKIVNEQTKKVGSLWNGELIPSVKLTSQQNMFKKNMKAESKQEANADVNATLDSTAPKFVS
jgi:hypothetical protein